MRDLIVFLIRKNSYGLELDYIKRIIQLPELTTVPDEHPFVDGMMSYEGNVLKVLNFRKMIVLPTYEDELRDLFEAFKQDHKAWIEALAASVIEDVPFKQTGDPHLCKLGQWLDTFNSCDDRVSTVLKGLHGYHNKLHRSAEDLLDLRKQNEDEAMKVLQNDIMQTYDQMVEGIDTFIDEFSTVADSLQKLLIYQNSGKLFGIKVDDIANIASVDETTIRPMDEIDIRSDCLEVEGVVELDGKLVNIIKSVELPVSEVA